MALSPKRATSPRFAKGLSPFTSPKPTPRLLILRPWRRKNVEHARAVGTGAHRVRHVAGRAPEASVARMSEAARSIHSVGRVSLTTGPLAPVPFQPAPLSSSWAKQPG